jgi:secreted PhoX family phosphatase
MSSGTSRNRGTRVGRRQFFSRTAAASALGIAGGAGLFEGLAARAAAAPSARAGGEGYGPLSPAGPHLSLPPGFQYSVVSIEGEEMTDGFPVPKAMDGMGAFPLPNGNVLLIRNHEDSESPSRLRPRPDGSTSTTAGILNERLETHYGPRGFAYDDFTGGGTTTLEVEPHGRRRCVSQHWSLVGTMRNCAGGVTPWGSWLSCEETFESPNTGNGATQTHGFVFEVPIDTVPGQPVVPVPLLQLGRFNHEAAAVDPATGIIYLTEDQGDGSGLYRFVPASRPTAPGQLASMSGVLQMLKVATTQQYFAATGQTVGVPLPVTWVDIPNPTPSPSTVNIGAPASLGLVSGVFNSGYLAGGTVFRRLEGCWFDKGRLFFGSTSGGDAGLGQIWVLDPAAATLSLVFESTSPDVLDACDNVTVTPRGGLIICEDNGGMQFLRGISRDGQIFDFAKNIHNNIEFAGACFSPDGQTLFVNLFGRMTVRTLTPFRAPRQIPLGRPEESELAMTLAIWGPWRSGLL